MSAFNEYKNNQRALQVCGYSANKTSGEDLICCSDDDLEKSKPDLLKVKRTLKYDECVQRYFKYRSSPQSSLITAANGVGAIKGEFPNMVAVGWTQDDKSVEYNCGGSIITELFIVTAAHCSSQRGIKPDVVRVGDLDLILDSDNDDVQQLNISRIIKHPEYKYRSNYHDIALIKVDREIRMSLIVAPACILYDPQIKNFVAAGYGQTGYSEKKANKLIKVDLNLVNQNECKDYYHNFDDQKLARGIIEEQICTKGFIDGGLEMDTCLGDSGGGLQYIKSVTIDKIFYEIPTLVGIVSFGIGCATGAPSVYTNVTSYVDWMESVIFQ
ncbi:unnamed protein product [Diamesa tonsa]